MLCPKCSYVNPEGVKFCGECGAKLEKACPQCGCLNPPSFKFCGECGQPIEPPAAQAIKDLSFDEKISRIQKYLPEGLIQKILSQRDRIEGERRQVTVLFCDMVGFTSLSEKLGPEGVYTLMDEVYEILIHKVNDFGGTVNELTGDGVMALFGAPVALEDAPQRAIRAGLAIHGEIARLSERLMREKGIPRIRMRVGVHSGPVVVGTVGNNLRVEFKALGDTVNVAARMESLAAPGAILVTEDTFRLTEGFFRYEALGEKEVKGKQRPVRVYQVIAPSSRKTRFDVSAERGLTPFVGRGRELELLLDGFRRAKEGMGQAYSIISEAGGGKSRFLYEFRKAIANEDVTFLEGKCLSYGKASAYHPVIDILKSNFEIGEDESDSEIREKVSRRIASLEVDEATTLPYLLEFLSVKDSGIDKTPMSPEGRRDRMIEAVNRIAIKGAEIRPLILAVEDLHWIDKSSEDVIGRLLDAIPGARVMVILTYRPEYTHTWGGRSYHNQITLNRLHNRESLLLVSHLLGIEEIDPGIQRLITTKTEGVPLFVEEFVKSLLDLGIIRKKGAIVSLQGDPRSLSIPSTIQEMIMARVDRLPDSAKAVLQAGSVIEREFTHELIGKVSGFPEDELKICISLLKDAELLYERGIYPRNSYIFRHALTREVVYDSILSSKRKEMHGLTARVIEELHKDDLSDHYEILAEHFFLSEDFLKAAEYSKRSARKAQKNGSISDAIFHARRRILCLERFADSPESEKDLIDARTVLGLYLIQIPHPSEARKAVEPIARIAREKGYRRRLGQIQTIMAAYYQYADEDFEKAIDTFNDSIHIASAENDIITLVLANFQLGWIQGWICDFDKARASLQKALTINEMAKNLWGIALTKASMAYVYWFYSGQINSAEKNASEALTIAKESGDGFSKGAAHTAYGAACYAKGRMDEAKIHLAEGKELCKRTRLISWAAIACSALAEAYFETKDFQKAREYYIEGNSLLEQIQITPSFSGSNQLGIAKSDVMIGEKGIDLQALCAIVEKKQIIRIIESWIFVFLGDIFLNIDDSHFAEAEHWICRAIEVNKKIGTRFHLGVSYGRYGEFFKVRHDRAKARQYLGKAVEAFKECGADGWVDRCERELALVQ